VLSAALSIAVLFVFSIKILIVLQTSVSTASNTAVLTIIYTIVSDRKKRLLHKQKTILDKQFETENFFSNSKKLQNK